MGTFRSSFKAVLLISFIIYSLSGCKLSDIDGSTEGLLWDALDGREDRSGPTKGYKPIDDNSDYNYEQAKAICEPAAEIAGDRAADGYSSRNNTPTRYDTDCMETYLGGLSCSTRAVNQSGGKWAAANEALTRSQNRRKMTRKVMRSCMAQYGWVK